jgi:aspartate aminotransferase
MLTPCWMDYPAYLLGHGFEPVLVPARRPSFEIDCDALAAQMKAGPIRAFVLSQPANPSGVLYTEDNLRELAATLRRQDPPPLLVSDEAHRAFLLGDERFVAPAAFYEHTCTIHSFGKAYLIQGQRIGYAAFSTAHPRARALAHELEQICRYMGIFTPTAHMQEALPALLRLEPDLTALARRRQRLVAALHAGGGEIAPGKHTFFVYARSAGGDMATLARLAEQRVLALPGEMFHDPGHVRFSLTATDDMVEQAARVLERGGLLQDR